MRFMAVYTQHTKIYVYCLFSHKDESTWHKRCLSRRANRPTKYLKNLLLLKAKFPDFLIVVLPVPFGAMSREDEVHVCKKNVLYRTGSGTALSLALTVYLRVYCMWATMPL